MFRKTVSGTPQGTPRDIIAKPNAELKAILTMPEIQASFATQGLDPATSTPEEFQSGHVPNAINLPLSSVANDVIKQFPNKDQVLLLHCLGGGRSAVAQVTTPRSAAPIGRRSLQALAGSVSPRVFTTGCINVGWIVIDNVKPGVHKGARSLDGHFRLSHKFW